jgi:hypothetical protein
LFQSPSASSQSPSRSRSSTVSPHVDTMLICSSASPHGDCNCRCNTEKTLDCSIKSQKKDEW